ncbi:MAG: DNA polymerase III subunit alpha [Chitinophagales bacterium]|nr:DNA polymerase III subunit alpha [Chitinophagales bacterium]
MQFSHLHCHTQYSLLDGATSIAGMMKKAAADGMPAVALTDHGNMFGAFEFVKEAVKNKLKPIVGCEFYVVEDRHKKSFTGGEKDRRYHQLLLAKNQNGYKNLSKLCSLGYIEGQYSKYPRIDKELILKYKEGLIATTCCLGAIVPQTILNKGVEEGEKVFLEWLEVFGDDYFIELQRHEITNIRNSGWSQEDINQVLIGWSKKYNVPVIATNDSHYLNEEDFTAHDILLCLNTGEKVSTPVALDDGESKKGFRFGFPNNKFFFKTTAQMVEIFQDIPEALDNTNIIVDRVEAPELKRDVLLPNFTLPEGFTSQDEYLEFLTYEGAKKRYGILTAEMEERISFELLTIKNSGYPGYFLIVQDFTTAARNMDVWVGPGRGSAAGSVVAYCLGITNVDPLAYNLLFERFLNPERVSLPDIDIDFDDEGREKVIDYVVNKYGKNQVAQIITYGTMAAKSSLKDVGRVMDIPLPEVDKVTKSLPDGYSLNELINDEKYASEKKDMNAEQIVKAEDFRKLSKAGGQIGEMIKLAVELEGSVRNTGVHACGIIITPEDITNIIPTAVSKDSSLLLTQFDNSCVESAGLLKMDFLGLRTLSIIKEAIKLIRDRFDIDIKPDDIPLDDPKTFELFQRGETNGIFQFESAGMQKHLKALKPTVFEDLIAMNALYRPGPMQYIPNYTKRKNGEEAITYDLPIMEEILKETYGITVYQEQVMLLSQLMAGFTKGQADSLRKAMGKKNIADMEKMYTKFIEGCAANGLDTKIVEKVWKDWAAFAEYAFNKSHATCYAYLANQTAYLKANYPAEFIAALLTNNMSNIDQINFFLTEARRLGIKILGPDVNESNVKFSVNKDGAIRFALSALKGVGEAAVEELIKERKANGEFKSVFDLAQRVNLRSFNKKAFESIAYGGGFDCFTDIHRAQYFKDDGEGTFIERCIKFGNKMNESSANTGASLFGDMAPVALAVPKVPDVEPFSLLEKLNHELDVTGIYMTGHPLDRYKKEIQSFCNATLADIPESNGKDMLIGGMIQKSMIALSKQGKKYGRFTLQDYNGTFEFMLFGETCLRFEHLIKNIGLPIAIRGKYTTKKGWNGEERTEFEMSEIHLLDEMRDKMTKSIKIQLAPERIDQFLIDSLEDIFKKNAGTLTVNFTIKNEEDKLSANVYSNKYRVNATEDLVTRLNVELGEDYVLGK